MQIISYINKNLAAAYSSTWVQMPFSFLHNEAEATSDDAALLQSDVAKVVDWLYSAGLSLNAGKL